MRLLTLKSVLVAVDLQEPSPASLRTAARLASLAGARLHLLHVGDGPGDEARLRDGLRAAVADAEEPASVEVLRGDAAEVVVEHASRTGADVVILGPHRSGAGQRPALGSTAARVVRWAPCPCLVTAAEVRLPLERVTAAIDASPAGGGVLSVALSWASALRPRGGQAWLTALHVPPEPGPAAERRVHETVAEARGRAGGAAYVSIGERVAAADRPAEEILRHAAADAADLLVVGTRGAERPTDELGSVSAAVARGAACPLLLVPPVVWMGQRSGRH